MSISMFKRLRCAISQIDKQVKESWFNKLIDRLDGSDDGGEEGQKR
jgi:hypothetical protein